MAEKKIYELITYDNYRDTELGVNGDDSVDLFIQQGKRIKELQENNETLKRSRAHFKKVAENVTYLLKKLNKFIGEPQTQELNYYKVIEDTKNYIEELKQSQRELAIENCEFKKEKLYFDLLFTRLQYIHKQADEFREEKERYGIEDMALDSVWRVFDLQKHDCCEYEEMSELENGIENTADDKLLRDIEHDLQFKPTKTVEEIFEEIQKIDQQIKSLKGEK